MLEECTNYLAAVTKDKTVFSADYNAFKSAFDSTIQAWTGEFDQAVKNHGSKFSNAIITAGKEEMTNNYTEGTPKKGCQITSVSSCFSGEV